jgi:hypothetical protein
MKIKVLCIIAIICFVLLQISCNLLSGNEESNKESNEETTTGIEKSYWGEWLIVKSSSPSYVGDEVFISEDKIEIKETNYGYAGTITMPHEDVNLNRRDDICTGMIQLNRSFGNDQASSEYFLLPVPVKTDIPTVSFTGRVVSPEGSSRSVTSRAVSGIGGIQVIIDNLNNPDSSPATVETDTDGNFIVEEATPGDTYEVSVEDQTTDFTPIADDDDMGTITITSGVNFKINRISNHVCYTNENTDIALSIRNIGSATAQGTIYSITTEDGLMLNSSAYGVFGTIDPGEDKSLGVSIQCDSFSGSDLIWKKIFIEVNDPINNKTWNDSVSIPFYRIKPPPPPPVTYTTINLGRDRVDGPPVFLTIIAPNGKIFTGHYDIWYQTNKIYYEASELPKMPGEYLLIVTNNGDEKEGMYTIVVGDTIQSSFMSSYPDFPQLPAPPTSADITKHKPNHTATEAPKVTLPIIAYSLRGHMDFYKINFE